MFSASLRGHRRRLSAAVARRRRVAALARAALAALAALARAAARTRAPVGGLAVAHRRGLLRQEGPLLRARLRQLDSDLVALHARVAVVALLHDNVVVDLGVGAIIQRLLALEDVARKVVARLLDFLRQLVRVDARRCKVLRELESARRRRRERDVVGRAGVVLRREPKVRREANVQPALARLDDGVGEARRARVVEARQRVERVDDSSRSAALTRSASFSAASSSPLRPARSPLAARA